MLLLARAGKGTREPQVRGQWQLGAPCPQQEVALPLAAEVRRTSQFSLIHGSERLLRLRDPGRRRAQQGDPILHSIEPHVSPAPSRAPSGSAPGPAPEGGRGARALRLVALLG